MDNETTNCSETMTATSGNENENEDETGAYLATGSEQEEPSSANQAPPSYRSATARGAAGQLDAGSLLAASELYRSCRANQSGWPPLFEPADTMRPREPQQQLQSFSACFPLYGGTSFVTNGTRTGDQMGAQMQTNNSKTRPSISSPDCNSNTEPVRLGQNDLRPSGSSQEPQMIPLSIAVPPMGSLRRFCRDQSEVADGRDNNQYRWLHLEGEPNEGLLYGALPINHRVISSASSIAENVAANRVGRPQTNQCQPGRLMQAAAPAPVGAAGAPIQPCIRRAPSSEPPLHTSRRPRGRQPAQDGHQSRPRSISGARPGWPGRGAPRPAASTSAQSEPPYWPATPSAGSQVGTNRKRRRHRSISGPRSVSSREQDCATPELAACGSTGRLPERRPKRSTRAGTVCRKSRSEGTAKAISAHCWLIDSSDDQAPSGSLGRPELTRRQNLTVAMMHQSQRAARRATSHGGRSASDLSPVYQDLSVSLKTNSLKMERILTSKDGPRSSTLRGPRAARVRPGQADELAASGPPSNAYALTRLSALLSLVSRLITNRHSREPAESTVSSSVQANSVAPYKTAGSLGVSSSSSTSAYATESSSALNSSGRQALAADLYCRPVQMRPLASSCSTQTHLSNRSSSVHYSLSTQADSLTGGGPQCRPHSYQYCESINQVTETEFMQPEQDSAQPGSSFASSSASSSSETVEQQQCQFHSAPVGRAILSDNELISAGSETGGFKRTIAAPLAASGVSSARRRWWWISLKEFFRRPCSVIASQEYDHDRLGRVEPASLASGSSPGLPSATARYKTLPSTRDRPRASTWRNVLSLAKADRVFRIRLIASFIVSGILVALLSLLGALVYLRANQLDGSILGRTNAGSVAGRFSRLIDQSDYDLSWLWPAHAKTSRFAGFQSSPESSQISVEQTDDLLRANLMQIERSERLKQLQQTVVHLSNLQLATDSFIDVTLLARDLAVRLGSNSTRPARELVAACLLANLHWPLLKWRHQSQQTAASFLGISLTPSAPEVDLSTSGQTLGNLLSLFMLVEAIPAKSRPNNQLMSQLSCLGDQILRSSAHLMACSSHPAAWAQRSPTDQRAEVEMELKELFCSQLTNKYRRMMTALTLLEYKHLAGSNNPLLESPIISQHAHSSRSLIGFLLDRLAVLNVNLVAETVLSESIDRLDLDLATSTDNVSQLNEIFEWLVRVDEPADRASNSWLEPEGDDRRSNLIDLARLATGESPSSAPQIWPNLELERAEFAREQVQPEAGRRQSISDDLLYPWSSGRLPLFAQPINYDLFLHPNLTTRLILGMVKIEFKLERPTRCLVLNMAKLELVDLTLWLKEPIGILQPNHSQQAITLRQIAIRRILVDGQREQLYIELQDQIEPRRAHEEPLAQMGQTRSEPSSGLLTFGDHLGGLVSAPSQSGNNVFVISIAYNKTSLVMPTRPSKVDFDEAEPHEQGINFLQYGDFYAQQPETDVKTILFTQFERANARRLIPCFDEPNFKAKFQLNIVHESQQQVLFNAVKRERVAYTSDGLLQMSVFEWTSIPISSYLVSFVVCDSLNIKSITLRLTTTNGSDQARGSSRPTNNAPHLSDSDKLGRQPGAALKQSGLDGTYKSTTSQKSKHIQVQILAQIEHLSQAEFASQLVPKLLKFYQSHLRHEYPLDKLDIIGLPSPIHKIWPSRDYLDTVESLGLIWFRSQLLLVDTNLISQEAIEQVSMMISHQLAHQYLGNIVGIHRWSDWWLFEALCQYFEASAMRSVEPEWALDEQFLVRSIQDAIEVQQFAISDLEASSGLNESGSTSADWLQDDKSVDLLSSSQLTRRSAIVHMLLFNLLPTDESRARLVRRCLELYHSSTMSERQFWHLLGQQLLEGRPDLSSSNRHRVFVSSRTFTGESSERTSFTANEQLPVGPDWSLSGGEDLGAISEIWFKRSGIPLVSVTMHRDRLEVRQERFSIDWWWSGDRNQPSAVIDAGSRTDPNATSDNYPEFESLRSSPEVNASANNDIWPVPLLFISKLNPRSARFFWLRERQVELPFNQQPLFQSSDQDTYPYQPGFMEFNKRGQQTGFWFKLNVNQSSMVRVNYDERNWEALTELLARSHYSNHVLNPLDRANLLDDALTLMRCGKLPVGLAMNLTMYLEVGERDYAPWLVMLRHLDQIQTLLNQNPLWHRYVLKLVQPIGSVVGWKDDGPHLMRKLRRYLFGVSLKHGDEKTINKAKQEFKQWFKNNRFLVPNLQELVYLAGVRYGDQQEWLHCWQKYLQLVELAPDYNATKPELIGGGGSGASVREHFNEPEIESEKRQLLTALASTHNTWLLEQFLNYSMDPHKIEPQHVVHVIQALGKNPIARLYLWRFVRLNWSKLLERFMPVTRATLGDLYQTFGSKNENQKVIETMIVESTKHFASELDYQEVKSFFEGRRAQYLDRNRSSEDQFVVWNPSIEMAVEQSLQNIRSNIYWRNHIEPKLARWLSQAVSSFNIS